MSAAGRRRLVRSARRLGVLTVAGALTVALAQHTTTAAFTAQTGDTGNQVSTASTFCTSSGGETVTAAADTTGYQSNPDTKYGTNTSVGAISASGANARAYLRFSLPTLPTHCAITGATLRLRANSAAAGRTIDVYRVDPAATYWTEADLSWNTMPPPTGTAVGSASLASAGWQEWTVTGLVPSLYSGVNNGFVLRDRTESSGTSYSQIYDSRDSTTSANRPQLVLTWG